MKQYLLIISFILLGVNLYAQEIDKVTLVVSGEGTTKEQATHMALRSAVEQAYGVFVSANTEILNDELVVEEIATVTSGNVHSYQELSAVLLPDSTHFVTLQAVVSTHKLAAYAQSKGVSCEFAGAVFGANLKLLELNQQNTKKAFQNLISQLEAFIPYLYEKKLTVGNPDINGNIIFQVDFIDTDATRAFREMITSTCQALNMSDNEVQQLRSMSAHYYECIFESTKYRFYSEFPEDEINKIQHAARYCYYIQDNLDDYFSIIPLDPSQTSEFGSRFGVRYYRSLTRIDQTDNSIRLLFNMDIERLKRITKFELKTLPKEYYYCPGNILFDRTLIPLKTITTIETPSQLEKLRAQNLPLIVYTDEAESDTRFLLSQMAHEYDGRAIICDADYYMQGEFKVEWNITFEPTRTKSLIAQYNKGQLPYNWVYFLNPVPKVLYIKNDKIIKYIQDEDYSEAALRSFIESICK